MVWYEVNQWRERPEPPLLLQRPSHVASWLLTCRTVFPGASPKNLASSEQQTTEAASPTCKSVKRSITTSVCHICHGPSEVHHSSSILNILNAKAEKLRRMLRKLNGRSMLTTCRDIFYTFSCQVARSPSTARFMALEPFTTNSPQSGTKTKPRQKSHERKIKEIKP